MALDPSPSIILVRPQLGENIGACARAMLNFGLTDLRIIAPRDGWPSESAHAMAAGAFEVMPDPQVFDTLSEALADLHKTYATTARPRDIVKPVFTPEAACSDASDKGKIGFVFGAERTGLTNDEIQLCSAIINIPTNPQFSSLNLAQSVVVLAYEWMCALSGEQDLAHATLPLKDSHPARFEDVEAFLSRLDCALQDQNFYRSAHLKTAMQGNVRDIFMRNELSDQELKTLHGIVSALLGKKSKPDV